MFKKGYTMFVHSWENDWDYHNTMPHHFTDLNEVNFYFDWLELFNIDSNLQRIEPKNEDDIIEELVKSTLELMKKHGLPLTVDWGDGAVPVDKEWLYETANEMLGTSEFYDFRVFENAEVYYFEQDNNALTFED